MSQPRAHACRGLRRAALALVHLDQPWRAVSSPTHTLRWNIADSGYSLGGSVGQYFPGEFNGTHFTLIDGAARIADFGKE